MTDKFNSEYLIFSYGPSKALKCLRYSLRNPDASARMIANATGASYNVAWAAKTDIKKHGAEVMIPIAKLNFPDPVAPQPVFRSKDYKPKVKGNSFEDAVRKHESAVLDALTCPDLDGDALVDKLRELGFERVTASTEETNERVPEPQVTKTPSLVTEQAHSTPLLVGKLESDARVSDGSTARYYELPDGAHELQDLISHKNMNAQMGEIFRTCYRMGGAAHSDELRDAKKIRFYIDAEIKRLGG